MNIESYLSQTISAVVNQLFELSTTPESIVLQKTKKEFEGDYTLVTFPFIKAAKTTPENTGQIIGELLLKENANIINFNVVKGFLNFSLANSFWLNEFKEIASQPNYGIKKANSTGKQIMLEYSSPNTNKPLHLGHIPNNLLGFSVANILKTFVFHGADDVILVDAHPHIGTNKLPNIISNMRETILKHGGEIHFHSKLIDINYSNDEISSVIIEKLVTSSLSLRAESRSEKQEIEHRCSHLILATGHSARDIYELLDKKKIAIEAKPFALGVRVEHPQEFIDKIQYSCHSHDEVVSKRDYLPASSYSLVHQAKGHGVYSFCMCPGGIIAPCATAQNEVVTNGWSPSKRNNPYANSGIVVGLELIDFEPYKKHGALAGLQLQKEIEQKAWQLGGKTQTAPAQNLQDFINNKVSSKLIDCSYQPGTQSVQMNDVLGKMIGTTLQEGFKAFDKKMRGYVSNEAIIVGVESRTSTPVRIPRDKFTLQHVQLKNLYPCAEGAGYAGGIVSAAMDGVNCVNAIAAIL